ncbi:hypothetical protein BJ138DRAFT_1114255 [Hygrophoropsis aurantiaca]|uniref:Uncharacterized protein n=1 Tax=Hygrophoropsis aurantiaca TaxID=72124 RepID=A0ACB8AAL9_9AGAM|nr:hypothetical protein BJ138DRAFT_1114255 [Hygrophoropsis aurantiaca]
MTIVANQARRLAARAANVNLVLRGPIPMTNFVSIHHIHSQSRSQSKTQTQLMNFVCSAQKAGHKLAIPLTHFYSRLLYLKWILLREQTRTPYPSHIPSRVLLLVGKRERFAFTLVPYAVVLLLHIVVHVEAVGGGGVIRI